MITNTTITTLMWLIGDDHGKWNGDDPNVVTPNAWYRCYEYYLDNCTNGKWQYYDSGGHTATWKMDDDASSTTGQSCSQADPDWDFISYNNHLHPIKFGTIDGTTLLIDSQIDEVEFLCFGVRKAEVFSGNAVSFCVEMLTFLVKMFFGGNAWILSQNA